MRRLRIFTWHIHGSYLYYLTQANHDFYIPLKPGQPGYGGRAGRFAWGDNVHEVPAEAVKQLQFDCILFQSPRNYLEDQYEILSPAQQQLPRIYLEHDPPREHPTDTRHLVTDANVLLVHVTPFNQLMWDAGTVPTEVIEHGVIVPDGIRYSGELNRGIVVVNNLRSRGRRLGADLFQLVRDRLPLDLVGMDAESLGGLGEVPLPQLAAFQSHYRFFFNPIRYTSLGLAVCEAMMIGMPIVGLATTEMAMVIENGVSGYVDTNPVRLVEVMTHLLQHPADAKRWGEGAYRVAQERFHIRRFVQDWEAAFARVTDSPPVSFVIQESRSPTNATTNSAIHLPVIGGK